MFKPLKESSTLNIGPKGLSNPFKRVVRGPFYLLASMLLFFSTTLILISLFTNNWQRTSSQFKNPEYYTYGLWFTCRHIQLNWLKNHHDIYCSTTDYSVFPWIHAVQVFYTIGAAINLFDLFAAFIGICKDFGQNNLGMPSLVFWTLLVSCIGQLIGISVYGGKGIADYSKYEADYSIILASIALGINALSALFFLIETLSYPKLIRRA